MTGRGGEPAATEAVVHDIVVETNVATLDTSHARFSAGELEQLVEAGADWVWQSNSDHHFIYFSESVEAATGLKPARALGKSWFDFFSKSATHNAKYKEHLADLKALRPFRDFVYEVAKPTENCRWVSVSGFPRFDRQGKFAGYTGSGRNVTAMIEALDELRETRRALSLKQSRERLVHDADAGRSHAEQLMAALNAMHDAFCYYDADDRLVLYNDAMVDMYAGLEDVIRPGVDFEKIIRCGVERGIFATGDVEPVNWCESLISRRREQEQWEQVIAFADGRFCMHREIRTEDGCTIGICTDVTDLMRRDDELARARTSSELLLSDLTRTIDIMQMGVVVLDSEMKAEIINRAFYSIWKVTPDDVPLGSHFRRLMDVNRHNGIYEVSDGEWEPYVAKRLKEIEAGDTPPREFRRADGCTMIYSITSLSGGKRLISYYDVTEMKARAAQLGEALEQASDARAQFESVLNSLPAAVIVYDRDDRYVSGNPKIFDVFPALAPAMRPGASLRDALVEAHAAGYFRNSGDRELDGLYDTDREAWIGGYLERYHVDHAEYERQNGDGRWFKVIDTRTPEGYFVGVRIDITEIKERENALRESMRENEIFRNLIDNVPVAIYAKKPDLRLMYVN